MGIRQKSARVGRLASGSRGIVAVIDGITKVIQAWKDMVATIVTTTVAMSWDWLTATVTAPFAWVGIAWEGMKATLDEAPAPWNWLYTIVPGPFRWVTLNWKAMKSALATPRGIRDC